MRFDNKCYFKKTRKSVMCGITGFVDFSKVRKSDGMRKNILRMTNALAHRGPDDSGVWLDQDVGISLGHRRLSIVDLSASGHQPMESSSGRYIISFNGEVYNFPEIKKLCTCPKMIPWADGLKRKDQLSTGGGGQARSRHPGLATPLNHPDRDAQGR